MIRKKIFLPNSNIILQSVKNIFHKEAKLTTKCSRNERPEHQFNELLLASNTFLIDSST